MAQLMAKDPVNQLANNLTMDLTWPGKTVADEWHVLRNVDELENDIEYQTVLLDIPISFSVTRSGDINAWISECQSPKSRPASYNLKSCVRYGYIWVTFGTPGRDVFEIPEYHEPDRRNIHAATIHVKVSAPRAIENFLDLAHFPFVHPGSLGEEPYTEIKDYDVTVLENSNEVLAQKCRVWQPMAMPTAKEGFDVEYIYRVTHPYCAILYKANAADVSRMDVISLFAQPVHQEECNANMFLSVIDDQNSVSQIRSFQQMIFGQDKPILENQIPKRLPLDLRAEASVRCDATSTTYRTWLQKRDVRFGTIPKV